MSQSSLSYDFNWGALKVWIMLIIRVHMVCTCTGTHDVLVHMIWNKQYTCHYSGLIGAVLSFISGIYSGFWLNSLWCFWYLLSYTEFTLENKMQRHFLKSKHYCHSIPGWLKLDAYSGTLWVRICADRISYRVWQKGLGSIYMKLVWFNQSSFARSCRF